MKLSFLLAALACTSPVWGLKGVDENADAGASANDYLASGMLRECNHISILTPAPEFFV